MFPFPSNGKGYPKLNPVAGQENTDGSFHSLQTGKGIASQGRLLFSQPQDVDVSIPFKRESASQDSTGTASSGSSTSFHSLQTGKHIARGCCFYKVYAKARKMSNFFQHPLNAGRLHVGVYRFASLQACKIKTPKS